MPPVSASPPARQTDAEVRRAGGGGGWAQVSAGTSWSNSVGADDEGHAVAPTLDAIPLRTGGVAVAVLAAGAHTAALLSEHGHILDLLDLPVIPRPSSPPCLCALPGHRMLDPHATPEK